MAAIDTLTNKVIATIPIGQAAQAVNYVPNAVPEGDGLQNLQPLGTAGEAAHFRLAANGEKEKTTPTSVSLFDQGLTQVLQASVTGLQPKTMYVLALSDKADGSGPLQGLSSFMTNPAGSAIVNAVGPIRQIVESKHKDERRYLVVASSQDGKPGQVLQVQSAD